MKSSDIIKCPVITEESMLAVDEKKYTFEVGTCTDKTLAKQAVESAFDVRVASVNILNVHPKFERMDKYAGYTKECHKAIITLTEDSKKIQLFGAAE